MTAETCAPTCSTFLCRPSGLRCAPRVRAMPRGCWSCGRMASTIALVRDLPDLLQPGDQLVVNDTRVIPASLHGRRIGRGPEYQIEANLIKRLDGSRWSAFAKPGKRLAVGDTVRFGDEGKVCFLGQLDATVEAKQGGRRGDALVCVPRPDPRPGDRRARRDAAAALHRVAPRGRRGGAAPTTRPCSRTTRARSRRRPRACISPAIWWRG